MTAAVIGYIAAVFSVSAFVPQAWRVVKTRDTRSLSTPMWVVECCAFAAWVGYGLALGELPIILPNAICLCLSAFILVMKLASCATKQRIADFFDPAAARSR
jgi:MtN3 and saliva related transmembrane protein